MMFQEIEEKAKAAQKETNPGAQHKALLDWGETLLNHCVGFLFGEYKKFQKIIEPVERGLYLAATRSVSLGQQWGFVRDIATNLMNLSSTNSSARQSSTNRPGSTSSTSRGSSNSVSRILIQISVSEPGSKAI